MNYNIKPMQTMTFANPMFGAMVLAQMRSVPL